MDPNLNYIAPEPPATDNLWVKLGLIILGLIILILGSGIVYLILKPPVVEVVPEVVEEATSIEPVVLEEIDLPPRTDSGTSTPPGFPKEWLLEPDLVIEEGYTLEYTAEGKQQLTVRYRSEQSVKQNFDGYKELLQKGAWIFVNEFESDSLSSIYGLRRGSEMNLTIREIPESGTEVVISYLVSTN